MSHGVYSVLSDEWQQTRNDYIANMGIIFTEKLGKMVAQYENLRDMILDLNTSFDINTAVEALERKGFSIMDKTYWQEKP